PDTVQSVTDKLLALDAGTRFSIAFPLKLSHVVSHDVVVENLRAQGFVRVNADGKALHLEELPKGLDLTKAKHLSVIVDRLVSESSGRSRITDAVSTAFREGDGDCLAILEAASGPRSPRSSLQSVLRFTERFECPDDGSRAQIGRAHV